MGAAVLSGPARAEAVAARADSEGGRVLRGNPAGTQGPLGRDFDELAALVDGLGASGTSSGAGAAGVRRTAAGEGVVNGANLSSVLSIMEMWWGDVGLLLSMPRQGLGNSAIASVASDEQLRRFDGVWAGMAITLTSGSSERTVTSILTWSLPFPVQPWATA